MHKLLIAGFVVFAAFKFSAQTVATLPVRVEVPAEVLHDEVPSVRITGLEPGSVHTVQAELVSTSGTVWRSTASFAASPEGVIDPSVAAPLSGSYSGVDAIGLLWSMTKTTERQSDPSLFASDDHTILSLSVRDGETTLAQSRTTLLKRRPGISATEIREPFLGTLFAPYGEKRLPAVLVLGGSEGGIPREQAALIASHGYVALAVAYFRAGSLPRELDRIPVETVIVAEKWLAAQPAVDPRRIGIYGGSKGAELALLAAARIPAIKAVVAAAPSSVTYQSIRETRAATSSWTFQGKEIPYAPYVSNETFTTSRRLVDLYTPSLAAAPPQSEIAIERIGGPILLLSGKNDALWPSATMADKIVNRSKRTAFRFAVQNKQYEGVGHHVAGIPLRPTIDSERLGGSAQAIAHAQLESWKTIIAFLNKALR